jgi:hypothetical protein
MPTMNSLRTLQFPMISLHTLIFPGTHFAARSLGYEEIHSVNEILLHHVNDSLTRKQTIETTSQVRKGGLPPLLNESITYASQYPLLPETVSRRHLTTTNHDRLQANRLFANERT